MASFKVGNVDATQSTSITNISNVPSKVNFEADSIEDYINCVKTQFFEEYNIELSDSEITEIEEIA